MRIDGPQITGSFNLNGDTVGDLNVFATTGSLNSFTSSSTTKLSSLNSFTSSANSRLNSVEGVTGSYATTGSNVFVGTQTSSGSIVPSVNNTYDLGSPTHQFRHVYISSGSLYVNGTKVLGSTAQELQITTDAGQSFKILESSSDTITLQSADGNITLATSGGGDVIMDPTNGVIGLKGTVTIYTGNKITSSDGNSIQFGNGIAVTGSIVSTTTSLVSGSSQISYSGLSGVPSDIISGSGQLTTLGIATTGSNTFNGNLTVTGFIDTQELRTTYISSSILYRSGSTKFGDELTDTHSFTGSILISGSISVPGSNLVSGSSQVLNGSGVFSGSAQLPSGIVSSSAQTIANLPSGVVSGSAQVISSLPSGTVSGSSQILNGTGFVKTTGASITYDNSTYLTTESDTLSSVTARGASTSTALSLGQVSTSTRLSVGASDQNYASIFVGGDITVGTNQYAILTDPQLSGTGDNYAVFANARIKASTAVTNTFGVYIPSAEKLSGASIVNNYALYIANQTAGSTINYSIYSSGGLNYFGGATTFNSSVRAASLNLNTAPSSDRMLYVSANLPTVGTSQFQTVINGTFVNAATTLYGVYVGNNSNVNVTNSYALFLESTGGSGTITNKYGVYQSGGSDKNYFAGSTGVGTNNPSSIFHVVVPESASNLSGVRIQGDTNNKLLVLGANATYAWIQSHGSVPLRLNELGNEVIMGLGSNVGIGTSTISDKLEVRGVDNGITISAASANRPVFKLVNGSTTMLKLSANASYGAIADNAGNDVVFFRNGNVSIGTTTESSGYQFTVARTARFNGTMLGNGDGSNAADNRISLNWDSGSKAYILAQQNVPLELGNNNTTRMTIGTDGYVSVTGGMKTDGTASIGSSVGLLQFAMDGTRFNSYGYSHVHIKTSILKGSDTMISFNIRGYYYSPNTIDTDMAFYNYNPVSYVYSPTAHVKAYGGLTITMYYSSDNYVCICVEGLSTYGGFALNWINTSLIQWGGRVYTLAWSKANTAAQQY